MASSVLKLLLTLLSKEKTTEMKDFLLHDVLRDREHIFMEVSEKSIKIGDIVLFNMESSSSTSTIFKHATVYCGEGEVIHFQSKSMCPVLMSWQPTERHGDGQLFTFQKPKNHIKGE